LRREGRNAPAALYARVQFLFAQIARETAGAASTRSSLRPRFQRGQTKMQTSGDQRREIAESYSAVIVRLDRTIRYSRDSSD
jgi:hypothetical protein